MIYMVILCYNINIFSVDNTKMTLQLSSPKDMARVGELKILLSGTVIRPKKKSMGEYDLIGNTVSWELEVMYGVAGRSNFKKIK